MLSTLTNANGMPGLSGCSLLGDSGKEPVAHDIKIVDIPLSKIHLDCLERMMHTVLPLVSNANFTSIALATCRLIHLSETY